MATSNATRPGQRIDARGVDTYYEVTGDGDPLVLLHGGMCTVETFDGITPALAERFRVYVPERRGHGRTPDVDGPISYPIMAEDTAGFMDAVGITSAHLVGWSDGSAVAALVAVSRPDLVRKLVLIGEPLTEDGISAQARQMLPTLSAESFPPMLLDLYKQTSPDGPDHLPVIVEKLKEAWHSRPFRDLAELERVQAPTLVMQGDDDMPTVEHGAAIRNAIPDAQLAVVPGAEHAFPLQRPDVVNRLVLEFLAEDPSEG
jgi:pimeloyl-ACP methyl ester carboxylesterase